jgi:hypothetical protein
MEGCQGAEIEHVALMPEGHVALFVVINSPRTQDRQANSDPPPLPRGEKLEVSGSISTRYSRSPDTGRSSIVRALMSSKYCHPSLGRTQSWYARLKTLQANGTGTTCALRLTWQARLLVVQQVSWERVAR